MKNTLSKSFLVLTIALLGMYYGYNLLSWLSDDRPKRVSKVSEYDRSLTLLRETGYLLRYYLGERDDRVVSASVGDLGNLFLRKEAFFHYAKNVSELEKQIFPRVKELLNSWEEEGVQAVLLPVPMKSSLQREEIPHLRLRSHLFANENALSETEDPDLIYKSLLAINSKKVIDLYGEYKTLRKSQPNEALFIPSDFHWTNYGASQAVRIIKEKILGKVATVKLEKTANETKYNYYLLNTFQLPERFLQKRPELQWREKLYTFEKGNEVQKFKRIVILGSSMCLHQKNTEFDFPHLVENAFGMKPVYFCQDGAGLNGSLITAVQAGFKLHPGDLLIWEFFVGDLPHSSQLELPKLEVADYL